MLTKLITLQLQHLLSKWSICVFISTCLVCSPAYADHTPQLSGVNLAGAEFNHGTFWPTEDEFSYFKAKGMNVFRIPFLWERLQPGLNQDFAQDQRDNLLTTINRATDNGTYAIIDPHNYARYQGQLIGSNAVPNSAFADLWRRLALLFADNPRVIFGLMNEPNSMPTEQWRDSANIAIAAIRDTGADQLILVPGNAWTGAHSWTQSWYGTPNAVVMQTIVDPIEHFAFDLHQYFDTDFSGTNPNCISGHGEMQLMEVTSWLRTHNKQGFLGEFAGADNSNCEQSVISALNFMQANSDAWLGWSWWAAGPEWGEYIFTLEPTSDFTTDRPQMSWLEPFLMLNLSNAIFANGFE